MKQSSLATFLVVLIIAIILGVVLYRNRSFQWCPPLVFWWIWLGFFVGVFETELYGNRERLVSEAASGTSENPWLDIWLEYSIVADPRYVASATNAVHRVEFTNALIQFALLVILFGGSFGGLDTTKATTIIVLLLMVQFANCVLYFTTLNSVGVQSVSAKQRLYLIISALWLVLPVVAIGQLLANRTDRRRIYAS